MASNPVNRPAIAVLLALMFCGCSSLSPQLERRDSEQPLQSQTAAQRRASKQDPLLKLVSWQKDDEDTPQVPVEIVPIWVDAVAHYANRPPVRGFGARVLFFGPESERPIRVDGTLVVYAFDDSDGKADRKADRKYIFPPEKLTRCYSKCALGHSYNIWIPWDEVGGPTQEVTLIACFIPKDGSPVASTPTRIVLPGSDIDEICEPDIESSSKRYIASRSTPSGRRPNSQTPAIQYTSDSQVKTVVHTYSRDGKELPSNYANSASNGYQYPQGNPIPWRTQTQQYFPSGQATLAGQNAVPYSGDRTRINVAAQPGPQHWR